MINRDTAIVQVAVLMIAIAILGLAIYKQQHPDQTPDTKTISTETEKLPNLVGVKEQGGIAGAKTGSGSTQKPKPLFTENTNSANTNLVKAYFRHMQAKEFQEACQLLSPAKCTASKPAAIVSFATEYNKYANGYEYISVKDFGDVSPSGKSIVCVKYSYRYKEDTNPGLISEILSYYIEEDAGNYVISDRVCEKKYKDGSGERPCPIQATQNFCVGKIK